MLEFPDTPLKQSAARLGFHLWEENNVAGTDVLIAKCDVCDRELVFNAHVPENTAEALEAFLSKHREACQAILSSLRGHKVTFR